MPLKCCTQASAVGEALALQHVVLCTSLCDYSVTARLDLSVAVLLYAGVQVGAGGSGDCLYTVQWWTVGGSALRCPVDCS